MIKYLIILGIIVLAWCPWLKAEEALDIVDARILQMQEENPDLCVMSVNKSSIAKVPFGYTEEVSYNCTIKDSVYGISKSHDTVFITFYKGLLGMPNKNIKRNIL